jgi:hypothetical protein
MAFAFAKLLVYQKATDLSDRVCNLTEQLRARYNHLEDHVNRHLYPLLPRLPEATDVLRNPTESIALGLPVALRRNASHNSSLRGDKSFSHIKITPC